MAVQFENKITIGNVYTIATVVIGLVIGWTQLHSRVEAVELGLVRAQVQIEKTDDRFQDLRGGLIRIEERVVSIAESLKQARQQAMK
jgi:hypothetical protein